ncbi:MAG: UxaA family hydrolase [Bacilli bacterium]
MNKSIKLNEIDNVAVALTSLSKGEVIEGIELLEDIPSGHKFAIENIKINSNIIKYGYPIGHALCDIKKGEHVHVKNLKTNLSSELEYAFNPEYKEVKSQIFNDEVKVFERKFNRYGIRNNLFIVPLVGCVNAQAELIKKSFIENVDMSLIDDVIICKHPYGCSQMGEDHLNTIKLLQSIVKHPNAGGVLVLALGCENNQLENFKDTLKDYDEDRVCFLKAQDVEDEVAKGTELCVSLYNKMINDVRVSRPLSCITVGLKCGGSDGFSGITANPLVGMFSDFLINNGGSTILSEVPEMFGAEQVLMKRASNKEVFDKIVKLINDFKGYYSSHNQVCYENPSPGNKAGGISTLEDKSLGCVQKAGLSKVVDVLYTGDVIKTSGLNLLNGPGNDMVACTNIASAGAQLILFTTGRGTPFGTYVPTIKISTNTTLFNNKSNWIDFNAGQIADGININEVFNQFKSLIIGIINGEIKTKNEINCFQEIAIFKDGVTL